MMKRTSSDRARAIVRWQFRLGNHLLSCGVQAGKDTFDVVTLPHWNVRQGVVRSFAHAANALRCHAEIAAALKERGWRVASYTN